MKKGRGGEPFIAEREELLSEADPKIARDTTLMHLMRFVDLINLLSKHNANALRALPTTTLHCSTTLTLKQMEAPKLWIFAHQLLQFPAKSEKKKKEMDFSLTSSAVPASRPSNRSKILPCHVTALRRYSGQRPMKLRELGPYAYDTTRSWERSDYDFGSSFEPWA